MKKNKKISTSRIFVLSVVIISTILIIIALFTPLFKVTPVNETNSPSSTVTLQPTPTPIPQAYLNLEKGQDQNNTFKITVDSQPGDQIGALQIFLSYDPQKITINPQDIQLAPSISNWSKLYNTVNTQQGVIKLAYYSLDNFIQDGGETTLFTINYQSKASNSGTISFTQDENGDTSLVTAIGDPGMHIETGSALTL